MLISFVQSIIDLKPKKDKNKYFLILLITKIKNERLIFKFFKLIFFNMLVEFKLYFH